jgi:hypothetical protein
METLRPHEGEQKYNWTQGPSQPIRKTKKAKPSQNVWRQGHSSQGGGPEIVGRMLHTRGPISILASECGHG